MWAQSYSNASLSMPLEKYWQTLEDKRNKEFAEGKTVIDSRFKQELQEVQMIQLEIKRIRELIQTMDKLITTAFNK